MPVITVRIKYHKVSITYSFPFCCVRHGSGLYWHDDVCSAVYRYYFCTNCTNMQCLLPVPALKGEGRLLAGSFWLAALRLTNQSQEILLGHSVFLNPAWPSYRLHDRLAIKIDKSTSHKGARYSPTKMAVNRWQMGHKNTIQVIMGNRCLIVAIALPVFVAEIYDINL